MFGGNKKNLGKKNRLLASFFSDENPGYIEKRDLLRKVELSCDEIKFDVRIWRQKWTVNIMDVHLDIHVSYGYTIILILYMFFHLY